MPRLFCHHHHHHCPPTIPGQGAGTVAWKRLCIKANTQSEGNPWGSSWEGVSLGDRLISKLHEQADSCRCCVELGHLVLVHNTPHAAHVRVCRDPLKLTPVKAGHSWSFPIVPPSPYHTLRLSILPFLTNPCLHSLTRQAKRTS